MDITSLSSIPPWDWPPDAGEVIAAALGNRRRAASERITAAELAGDLVVMDDRMAGHLLSVLESVDEPEDLRAEAATSLGPALELAKTEGYDDPFGDQPVTQPVFQRMQTVLHGIYSDASAPKILRRRALEASVRAAEEWHSDAILASYSSDDPDWKLTAVFCMQFSAGFDAQILETLDSANRDLHIEAVRAAGHRELSEAWPHVRALLASASVQKPLLLAAIAAAALIRPDEAAALLDPHRIR
jgi:hypothetical protein